MISDQIHELRVLFVEADVQDAFATKESVKNWLTLRGETSFVEGEVEGDAVEDLDAVCHPLLLYSFDLTALRVLKSDLEKEFDDAVLCDERTLAKEAWQSEWQQSFEPITTKRFVIAPPWSAVDDADGRVALHINPGVAFGDAQHETTRLCLEVLEEIAPPKATGQLFLDVGTGTGILAIAAKKLGWERVTATDIAADAILAGQENAVLNGVEIAWHRGSFPPGEGLYDAIVANIFGHILRGMAADLVARLKPGGWLMLSGIIEEEKTAMLACFQAYGLHEVGCRINNGWMAMVLRK